MNSPMVSVIMPVYNAELFLNQTIDSILNQDFKDFEFLICDDCSTDKSLSVINSYSDERIILLENKVNKGYIETLNSLIKISKGKYVARQDNDDISVSSRLRIQFNFMELNLDHAMCGGKINTFGKKNKINFAPVNHEEISAYFLFRNPFNHPTVFIRRKILNNKIKYNKNFFPAEDYELWFKISQKNLVANIDEVLLFYRIHEKNTSKIHENLQLKSSLKIRKIIFKNYFDYDLNDSNNHIFEKINYNEKFDLNSLYNCMKLMNEILNINSIHKKINHKILLNTIMFFWFKTCFFINDFSMFKKVVIFIKPSFVSFKNLTLFLFSQIFYKSIINQIK